MTPQDSSRGADRAWQVTTTDQARLISDPRSRAFLVPFLGRKRSVSEAAREVGCPLDAMHYRVRRFAAAGLVKAVEERPRAGRAIKLYRAVADAFYVPFELTPYAEIEERIRKDILDDDERMVRILARAVRASGLEGRRLYRTADGDPVYASANDDGPPQDWRETVRTWPEQRAVADHVGAVLELSHREALELLASCQDLLDRLRDRGGDGTVVRRPYRFQFAVVPWDDATAPS